MVRRIIRWAILLAVVAAIGLYAWRAAQPEPMQVVVKAVTRGTVTRSVANTRAGTVKACRRAKLSPSVGGQIARLPVKEGDVVQKGQLLMGLWNDDLKAQSLLTEREVAAAGDRARAACLKAGSARRSADRLIQLRQKDVVPEDRTENAVAEATSLEAECKARWTEVRVLEAKLAVSRANIQRTQLNAPFDGVIAQIHGELFEFVTPSPVGIPTPPAIDIIDKNCFYVTAPIDEVDAAGIDIGLKATISLDAFRDRHFEGRVRRVSDFVLDLEKQARTVDVEVAFIHSEDIRQLLAGYSADIEVILDERHDVVRVPTEAASMTAS
ncbi:MAG: efflux RND transporter periplasmic adaptor subunit, partial [Desulfatitalea sp.]|nr:efflux RND transporter periplasmic adaptor subunit [Desulfatitalea sp.]